MNRTSILLFIISVIAIISGTIFYKNRQPDTPPQDIVNTAQDNPTNTPQNNSTRPAPVSIHTLKLSNPTPGIYSIEGYVVKKYVCPPCSNNDQCKPCMANHIIVSESVDSAGTFQLSNTEMILFSPIIDHYKIGTKYQFIIKVTERKSTSEPINNVEIVDYAPVI